MTHLQVNAVWRKSSRCESGTCVEVAVGDGVVAMRDAKNVDGPVLTFTDQAWATFLDGIRIGEFETH